MTDLAAFHAAAQNIAEQLASLPQGTRWFLDCDTDADGLCAAAVASACLRKLGHRPLVRASRDKDSGHYERVLQAENIDAWMFLDKGTSHIAVMAAANKPCFIVDHHNIPDGAEALQGDQLVMLNPRNCGLDGSRDASASTTAAILAFALLGADGLKYGPTALSGAIGDWQHTPSWQGWNAELRDKCIQLGHVTHVHQAAIIGADLAMALSASRKPTPGLETRAAATAWLKQLGIDGTVEVEDLNRDEQSRLVEALALARLANGERAEDVAKTVRATDHNARLQTSLRHVFRLVDACGRQGHAATGIALLMGDATARAEAQTLFTDYKSRIVTALDTLERDGPDIRSALQVAWTQVSDLTGMVGGIGMIHTVQDKTRPLCVLAKRDDGRIQLSTRGLPEHVAAGLDLGAALTATSEAFHAEGGGHPVAAGAVLKPEEVEPFIQALDEALMAQGFLASS